MKNVNLFAVVAVILSAVVLGVVIESRAWSNQLPTGVPTYIPIGTDHAGKNNSYTTSWLLDTSNQRVVVCFQDMSKLKPSAPNCNYTDLPK